MKYEIRLLNGTGTKYHFKNTKEVYDMSQFLDTLGLQYIVYNRI